MPQEYDSFFKFSEDSEVIRPFFAAKEKKLQDKDYAHKFFDSIAPLVIYHLADLRYKKQAKKALKDLRKLMGDDWVEGLLTDKENGFDLENLKTGLLQEIYNDTFAYIVEENVSDAIFQIDKYGGYNYVLNNEILFGSDDSRVFPWFLGSETIIDRIKEHNTEHRLAM